MEELHVGDFAFYWLREGLFRVDGGGIFGVVPKAIWSKRYPYDGKNRVPLRCDPILLQTKGKNILIEGGIGRNKFNEKQKNIYGVIEDALIENSLKELGLRAEDIDIVALTHMHFDHMAGTSRYIDDELKPSYPKAEIYVTKQEWEDAINPHPRSANTYRRKNWEPIKEQLKTFEGEIELTPGVKMIHTGGHTRGHSLLTFENKGEKAIHFGDLMCTSAHLNPLWVQAFDDYPMDSIEAKNKWLQTVQPESWWILFYHDTLYRAIRVDQDGEITEKVEMQE